MGWVRRINGPTKQRRCDNCAGVIDVEEEFFLTINGEKFCIECPPDEEHGEEHRAL